MQKKLKDRKNGRISAGFRKTLGKNGNFFPNSAKVAE
jgi:hypothetical protein